MAIVVIHMHGGAAAGANPLAVICGSTPLTLKDFQAKGFDVGSTVAAIPSAADIVAMGRTLLWA